jgi:serine/threonine-protein kinase
VKILDFGIAWMRNREAPETEFGVVKGKPSYMAPEQIRNQGVDRRSDIYGISVVLHELLTGKRLFPEDSIIATAKAIERGNISRPSKLTPEVPKQLDDIVLKGLQRDPEQRFPDARAMAAALESLIKEHGGEQLPEFVDRELASEREAHWAELSALLDGEDASLEDPGDEAPTLISSHSPFGPSAEEAATVFSRLQSERIEVTFPDRPPASSARSKTPSGDEIVVEGEEDSLVELRPRLAPKVTLALVVLVLTAIFVWLVQGGRS